MTYDAAGNLLQNETSVTIGGWTSPTLNKAAGALLSENSRQGFSSKKINVHRGLTAVNFKTATRIEARLRPEGIRSRCQSLNRYAYVLNNPARFTDRLGLSAQSPACLSRRRAMVTGGSGSCGGIYEGGSGGVSIDGGGAIPIGLFGDGSPAGGESAVQCPSSGCSGFNSDGIWWEYGGVARSNVGFFSCVGTGSFSTENAAGAAAVNCINGQSIAENIEYGGNITYDPLTGKYSFTLPVSGTPSSVDIPGNIPSGLEAAADYHTHADYDPAMGLGNEIFSNAGAGTDIPGNNASGLLGYLGTPGGRIEVYSPNNPAQLPGGCVLLGTPVPINPTVPMCH
jgi:hypothetical protein